MTVAKEVEGSDLFQRTMARADSQVDDPLGRGDLMRRVWEQTPWMVNAYTDSIANHGRYREIMDWCREKFGPEAWPIHGKPGVWYSGGATVMGWTWMGFATKEMMDQFVEQWGDAPEDETRNG